MNTPQHTPGPWKATILDSYGRFEIAPADGGRCIAKPGSGWGDASRAEEQEANARLIAAAPELLAILKIARDYIADNENASDILNEIDTALAKAEGKR